MPINMQIEYPKLVAENCELKYDNEGLHSELLKHSNAAYQLKYTNKRLMEALESILRINAAPSMEALVDKLKNVAADAIKNNQPI